MINSLFILFSLFVSISGFAQDITINVDGKKLTVISLEEIKQLKIDEVEFFNKVTLRAERYKGVPTMRLIEKFYPETQNLVEVEFISGTDFNPLVDIELLRRTNSILAFERSDGDKFVRYSKKEKILVPLGPLYLVWALKQVSKEDRLLHTSIYQINTINLVTNKMDFGVKENSANASLYLGYQSYKRHCLSCHALGNLGGGVSFDLIKNKTLESKGAEYVKKYIRSPELVNLKTKMLPLSNFKNREDMIQGIVDFLTFMQDPETILRKQNGSSAPASYKVLRQLIKDIK
jgi:hypothetical protein